MTYDSLIPLCHPGPLDIRLGNSILTWRENLACAEALRNNWLCGCCQFMSFSCQQILCCTREEIYLTRDVQPNMFNCLASGRMAETDVTDSLELRKPYTWMEPTSTFCFPRCRDEANTVYGANQHDPVMSPTMWSNHYLRVLEIKCLFGFDKLFEMCLFCLW